MSITRGRGLAIEQWLALTMKLLMIFHTFLDGIQQNMKKYQPSGEGSTHSPPATPHCLQHLTACRIQNGRQGQEISQTLGYWTPPNNFR